jgi:cell division protein FtsL
MVMTLQLNMIEDKIEFYEANEIKTLEKKINEQIENNKALLLRVHSVSHQMHVDENGRTFYSAVVHYKINKTSF